MFKKILVCVDGSGCAFAAARTAAAIARHHGAEVVVLTVFHHVFGGPADIGMWPIDIVPVDINECAREDREAVELQVAPIFAELTTPYRVVQEIGLPVEAILCAAQRESVDLIVVGSRDLRGIKGLVLGSVSNAVMHHADCPVLIVRGDSSTARHDKFQNILVASDGSAHARKAEVVAVDMAQKFATSLTVLNVCTDLSSFMLPEEEEAIDEEEALIGSLNPDLHAGRALEVVRQSVKRAAKEAGVYCSYVQRGGDPYEGIVRYAEEHNTDVIVIGSRGLGGFEQVLVGSVSHYVAHHASCPVLVVR